MKKKKTVDAVPALRLEWMDACELRDNPNNWRRHPPDQLQALSAAIAEVGWAGAALYNERTKRLIDGHARKEVNKGEKIPVLIGSWTEEQEKKILATLDPLAAMAEADAGKLDDLLRDVSTGDEALATMLADLAGANGVAEKTELKPLDIRKPPAMSWALIGIPTVRFAEINERIESIAAIEGVFCETTANDG